MRLYWEVARRGFRQYSTYRAATAAGVFTNTVFGFMRAYVFIALFRQRATVGAFNLQDTITYVFITQGLIMAIYLWGWAEIANRIRSGDVVTDLFRPFDFQGYWLAQDLGRAAYHAISRGIAPFLLAAIVFDLRLPERPSTWLVFALCVFLAVCVSFGLRFLANLSAFWLLDYRGTSRFVGIAWTGLAGFIVPLDFLPDSLESVLRTLPFAATVQVPIEVFLEKHAGSDLVAALGFQAAWAVALLAAGRFVLARATRRVVTQGG